MEHYAGIDVSLESASVCVVEAGGRIVREAKVASEPDALIAWFGKLAVKVSRIALEAGPLSQWLYAGMREAGLPVELLETRHVRDAFKAMPVKTDRNDARGIAQLMRLGWFRPVIASGPLPHLAFEAAIASLTAARDQAEKRTDEAQQRADQAEAHADELRERLDKLLHDQKAADAIAVEILMKSEEQRQAEIARKARGLVARLRAAWRGE